ncbi:hypothetical protein [Cobetia sp. Ld8]|uniref:hypothetical protein n=1 Tax=Cobetia sp. Ld8 TaxID=649154 RepID=UPI00386FBD95
MTTLRDMPMISVEQKNAFREAALKVEAERDELAAQFSEMASLADSLTFASNEGEADEIVQKIVGLVYDEGGALAHRDARMKAEALEEARSVCMSIECGQREMSYKYTETDGDGDEMVVGPGVDYGNKAMGAGHCRERIAELIAEYREQAATEAMDAIDGEDGDFANVRGVVERMIAAGYRKQAEGNGDE